MHLGTLSLDTFRSLNEALQNGSASLSLGDTATLGGITYKVALDGRYFQFVASPGDGSSGGVAKLRGARPGPSAVFRVMTTPPTVAISQTNPLTAGQQWRTTSINGATGAYSGGRFAFAKAGAFRVAGANADQNYIRAGSTLYDTGAGDNVTAVHVLHEGARLVLAVKGAGSQFILKVNDEYVSLTALTTPNDGNMYYIDLDFGSSAMRRVTLLGYAMRFAGAWTGLIDSLQPAPIRGPRVIIQGDSFTEGAGSTCPILSWVQALADWFGWDDVWPSGVGSTGLIAAPGTKKTLDGRAATDLYPFLPDLVLDAAGINDNGQTYAAVLAAASARFANVKAALPKAFHAAIPCFWAGGAGTMSPGGILTVHRAIRQAATDAGVALVDVIQQPLGDGFVPQVSSLTASAASTATAVQTADKLVIGSTYAFADGGRFVVKSQAGSPNVCQIDRLQGARAAGDVITEVGPSFWTGTGRAGAPAGWGNADVYCGGVDGNDTTHPNLPGHRALGISVAGLLDRVIASA